MDRTKHGLLVAFGIIAALALPSSSFASHGADDTGAPEVEHAGQVDDHQQEAADQHGAEPSDHRGAEAQPQPQPQRTETYNLRGGVVSVDPTAHTVVVQVKKANHGRRGRALVGQSITVDLSGTRVRVPDSNGDGKRSIDDIAAGDAAELRVRLPRSQPADLSQPIAAQRFVDRAARAPDDPANHS
jgi:hypothetical protein